MRQQSEQPLHPSSYSDDVPQSVGDAVLVALDSDPAHRFAAAGELADALRRGLGGESPSPDGRDPGDARRRHRPRPPATCRAPRPAGRPAASARPPGPPAACRRRPARPRRATLARNLLALIALLLLAAVVAGRSSCWPRTDSEDRINLEDVVKDNVDDQVDELRSVIEDNTQK